MPATTSMSRSPDYFTSDPNWAEYATQHGITLPNAEDRQSIESLIAALLDIPAGRDAQAVSQEQWVDSHSLKDLNQESCVLSVQVRDGASVSVKITWPDRDLLRRLGPGSDSTETSVSLPVLFVMHGGGWVQGTHVSEEQWLLWPIYGHLGVVIVSVEYRLAPEHKFPVWIEDCWDVLEQVLSNPDRFSSGSHVRLDTSCIVLAGSSAGATIAAVLSQRCRDRGTSIKGVVLNVPVLCDYRHLPYSELRALNENGDLSYEQCTTALLSSGVMKAVWDLVIPSAAGGCNPLASPLLGRVEDLPPHLIYVAGQDPLRDEGLWYARRLEDQGVSVELEVYAGVPHTFAEIHELDATRKFWMDLRGQLAALLGCHGE